MKLVRRSSTSEGSAGRVRSSRTRRVARREGSGKGRVRQAAETLGMPEPTDVAAAVPDVFRGASETVARANAVGWKDGAFFLPDGREVDGKVYTWGSVGPSGGSAGSGGGGGVSCCLPPHAAASVRTRVPTRARAPGRLTARRFTCPPPR